MRFRAAVAAGPTAFVLAASAACGGDGGDSEGGTQQPSSNPQVPAGAPFVDQDNLQFTPRELTVQAGEKVYFQNSETALHTVNINGTNESGTMRRNDVFTWTFEQPGEYKISCDFHAKMKSTITVSEASATSSE